MATVKNFTNFTKEDFTCSWDGVPRTIKAGESKNLPGYLADHFAKHLVDRKMIEDGKDMSLNIEAARKPYLDQCFVGETIEAPTELDAEIASLNKEEVVVEKKKVIKKVAKDSDETDEFKEIA